MAYNVVLGTDDLSIARRIDGTIREADGGLPGVKALGLPLAPFLAASLSGGVFGDHASPISDTTIVSSLASATDVIDHVRTQLPYALTAGGVAIVGFAVIGALV